MFDFAWSEIALIGVVALIAIGPKDMPVAIKAVAEAVKKARRMAGEFQVHVDEMVREANLHEVRDQINDIRRMDIKGKILSAVDNDGTLRKTMAETPFETRPPVTAAPVDATPVTTPPLTTPPPLAETAPPAAEAMIPAPGAVLPDAVPPAPAPMPTVTAATPPPADAHQPSLHA